MKANQLSDVQLPVKIISFNTGREYSSCGQRIAAVKLSTGNIAFVDHDRGLDGVTPPVDALMASFADTIPSAINSFSEISPGLAP